MHGVKGSQNGFDNSGKSESLVWTTLNRFQVWVSVDAAHAQICDCAQWAGQWGGQGRGACLHYLEGSLESYVQQDPLSRRGYRG